MEVVNVARDNNDPDERLMECCERIRALKPEK